MQIDDHKYTLSVTFTDGTKAERTGTWKENGDFISEFSNYIDADIKTSSVFCIRYQGIKLYSTSYIVLEIFYDIMICAGLGAVIYALCDTRIQKNKPDKFVSPNNNQ